MHHPGGRRYEGGRLAGFETGFGCAVAHAGEGVLHGLSDARFDGLRQAGPVCQLRGEEQVSHCYAQHFCDSFQRIVRVALVVFEALDSGVVERRVGFVRHLTQGPTVSFTQFAYVDPRGVFDDVTVSAAFFHGRCILRNNEPPRDCSYSMSAFLSCCFVINITDNFSG